MYTSGRLALSYAVLAALLSIPLLAADKPNETVPPAPIPSQILNAKNVFISNAGGNLHTLPAYIMSHTASPNGLYDQFYAAIKSWGKYESLSYQLLPKPIWFWRYHCMRGIIPGILNSN